MSAAPTNPFSPAAAALARARADYNAALMSDPSDPSYDRLCSMAEERVADAEQALADAPAPALATPPEYAALAVGALSWGDFAADFCAQQPAGEPQPAPRDFSALRSPHSRRSGMAVFGSANPRAWQAKREAEAAALQQAAETAHYAATEVQDALDREWACANLGGPGCPFCDSTMGGCSCWRERAEMHRLQERREAKARRAAAAAAAAAGTCSCDLEFSKEDMEHGAMCGVCQAEDEARCDHCGQNPCAARCCGGCGGCEDCCGPPCERCGGDQDRCCCYEDDQDRESACDCGACEEHDGRDDWGF